MAPLLLALLAGLFAPVSARGQGLAIEHEPAACLVALKFPRLNACFKPPSRIARARVYFRGGGTEPWYYVEMKSDAPCYSAILPKPRRTLRSVEYYVVATDRDFAETRTAEHVPEVVTDEAQCRKGPAAPIVQNASVVVGSVGAAGVPAGFLGAGVAGAGISTGVVLGVVGAGAAVTGGVAVAGGSDDTSAGTAGSPVTTTPAPSSTVAVGPTTLPPTPSTTAPAAPTTTTVPSATPSTTTTTTTIPGAPVTTTTTLPGPTTTTTLPGPTTTTTLPAPTTTTTTRPGAPTTTTTTTTSTTSTTTSTTTTTTSTSTTTTTTFTGCTDRTAPSVRITAPGNGNLPGPPVVITVNASDAGGSGIDHVEFYWRRGSGPVTSVGSDRDAPYQLTWNYCVPAIPHTAFDLVVRAFDRCGNRAEDSRNVSQNNNCRTLTEALDSFSWTSDLGVAGSAQVVLDGADVFFAGQGRSVLRSSRARGLHRVEGVVVEGGGRAGTWRFDLAGANVRAGSLRVLAGDVMLVAADQVVFRVRGRSGERVVFAFALD